MNEKKSRWTDPAIIIAALAVINGAYWQYQAIGREDGAALNKASGEMARQLDDQRLAISDLRIRLELNKSRRDEQMNDLRAEIERQDHHR